MDDALCEAQHVSFASEHLLHGDDARRIGLADALRGSHIGHTAPPCGSEAYGDGQLSRREHATHRAISSSVTYITYTH